MKALLAATREDYSASLFDQALQQLEITILCGLTYICQHLSSLRPFAASLITHWLLAFGFSSSVAFAITLIIPSLSR